jgi:uncharacterized protein
MKLNNSFTVDAPTELVWKAMLDFERVAGCVPGSDVVGSTDDGIEAHIRVKVGPMSMKYRGVVSMVEQDESAHRAVMRAEAREARGQGTATALMTMDVQSSDPVNVTIETDLEVTGRVAQMGRGVMQDVAGRIVDDFAVNFSNLIAGDAASSSDVPPAVAGEAGNSAEHGDGVPGRASGPVRLDPAAERGVATPASSPSSLGIGRLTVAILRGRARALIARVRRLFAGRP